MCVEIKWFWNTTYPYRGFRKMQRMKYPFRVFQPYKRSDKRFRGGYFDLINRIIQCFAG